jgi:acetyltransferase-like isoleucine patch superfamily enzyme
VVFRSRRALAAWPYLFAFTIGARVVAAGTVVTTNLPPMSICVGVPAKVIGYRRWGGRGAKEPKK